MYNFWSQLPRIAAREILALGCLLLALCYASQVLAADAVPADLLYRQATAQYQAQAWDSATELLTQFLAAYPEDSRAPKVQLLTAEVLVQQAKWEAADYYFQQILASNSAGDRQLQAEFRHAECLYFMGPGQKASAQAALAQFAQQHPGDLRNGFVLAYLADLTLAAGEVEEAAKFCQSLVRDFPNSPLLASTYLVQARAFQQQGNLEGALVTYRQVIAQQQPSDLTPTALLAAAKLLDDLEQDGEAAELLEQLIDTYGESDQVPTALYQLGFIYRDLKQPAEAKAAFAELFEKFPQNSFAADAGYRLARLHYEAQDLAAAFAQAEKTLPLAKEASLRDHLHYLQGEIRAEQRQWPAVAKLMQIILDEQAALPRPIATKIEQTELRLAAEYWLAEVAYRQGDFEAALVRLEKLDSQLQTVPGLTAATWHPQVPLRRAQVLAQQKQWAQALELAESLPQRYPQFAQQFEADYLRGRALASQAKFEEAREAYQTVLDSSAGGKTETAAMAQWMIGESFFHQKRFEEALAAYQLCQRNFNCATWQAASLLQAGKCQQLLGRSDEAQAAYRQVTADFGESSFAPEAGERLQILEARLASAKKKSKEIP